MLDDVYELHLDGFQSRSDLSLQMPYSNDQCRVKQVLPPTLCTFALPYSSTANVHSDAFLCVLSFISRT